MITNTNATIPAVRPPPQMPPFDRKRRSLMDLVPRHLDWIEKLADRPIDGSPGRPSYNRSDMLEFFVLNYDRYFGCLRGSKIKAVPSDELRKFLMVSTLLDLVDDRRAGCARAARESDTFSRRFF
jgi:hypothetical protein